MTERLFLTYANESLKNNPQRFHKIFEQLDSSLQSDRVENRDYIAIDKTEIDKIIEYIIDLSEITDSQDLLSYIEQHGSINHYDDGFDQQLRHAVEAIAGEREEFYSYVNLWMKQKMSKKDFRELVEHQRQVCFRCDLRKVVETYTGKDLCEEQFLQKCYECYQLNFRYCLLQIVQGKEYVEIEGFKDVMLWSEDISTSKTVPLIEEEEGGEPFRHRLASVKHLFPSFYEFANGPLGNSYSAFNDFSFSLASYSLTEFLIANDRRKLKFCPYCERFFIARDIKRKRCCYSQNCERKWQRDKKKVQRETDPVRYL